MDALAILSDLAPTFLEAAGLEPPEMMTARSLSDIFEGAKSEPRDAAFIAMERHDGCRKGGKALPRSVRKLELSDSRRIDAA